MSHFDSGLQCLGVPEMNADHRVLVEIADRIDDLVSTKHFIDIDLTLLINGLIQHSIKHFEREDLTGNTVIHTMSSVFWTETLSVYF